MKKEFFTYLDSIGIAKPIHERIETIYEFYKEVCPEEITGIFVSEYIIKESGERVYENLWFFSSKCCMEAKNFITQDNFDMDPIKNRIICWTVEKKDYDFKKATEKSRFSLTFYFPFNRGASLKASKENCDYLKEIFSKYIVVNIED